MPQPTRTYGRGTDRPPPFHSHFGSLTLTFRRCSHLVAGVSRVQRQTHILEHTETANTLPRHSTVARVSPHVKSTKERVSQVPRWNPYGAHGHSHTSPPTTKQRPRKPTHKALHRRQRTRNTAPPPPPQVTVRPTVLPCVLARSRLSTTHPRLWPDIPHHAPPRTPRPTSPHGISPTRTRHFEWGRHGCLNELFSEHTEQTNTPPPRTTTVTSHHLALALHHLNLATSRHSYHVPSLRGCGGPTDSVAHSGARGHTGHVPGAATISVGAPGTADAPPPLSLSYVGHNLALLTQSHRHRQARGRHTRACPRCIRNSIGAHPNDTVPPPHSLTPSSYPITARRGRYSSARWSPAETTTAC